MSKFKIYKASAGSGKTYSLVYEYIKILIENPNEYKHILAVTFTNDATEEMKSRVLSQLKQLATLPEKSPYIEKLVKDTASEPFHIGKRAAEALGNILHDYSNFNISTIDTFFQKILRAFAKDIGISAAYNLHLDEDSAIQEITENVISNTTDNNRQSKWLMKAALDKIQDGKNWNIREELKSLFKETFKENYQVKENRIKENFKNEEEIEELQKNILDEIYEFENELTKLATQCNIVLLKNGLTVFSFPYGTSSFYAWIDKLANQIIEEPKTRFLSALNNVDSWYTKNASNSIKENIIHSYVELNEAINKTYQYYLQNIGRYNSNLLVKQNLSYFVMLDTMVEEMMKYKEENDVLFISDTNQFIKEVIGDNDESFIFEKAGNYYHHYLIDEFQDTSKLQWGNFKPLISNAVSQGNTSMVVGDVKQSIYRFRNGDWRLLHEQAGTEITHHEVIPLKQNHRSLENVVLFNNTLYNLAPKIAADIYSRDVNLKNSWDNMFAECYEGQEQIVPEKNKNSGGYIKVKAFSKLSDDFEDSGIQEQQLNELVSDIKNALSRGYKPNEIAILVFTGKQAYATAAHLRKCVEENNLPKNVNVVTQSSLNISNSHTVRVLIASLRYLLHRKDQVSLANIFLEYQQYFIKDPSPDFLKRETDEKISDFVHSSSIIKSLPLQILVEHLIRFFNLEIEKNEHIFLQHFKDSVYDYLKKNADDLSDFVEWWDEHFEKFQVEVPQNENSLEIITIHKSKGLEFEIVFIPFAEWALDSTGLKGDTLWLDLDKNGMKTLPVKYSKQMQQSVFVDEYLETKFYNYLDKLNLLYVATTRAVRELYIYTNRSKSFSLKELKPTVKTIFNHILLEEQPLGSEQYLDLTKYKNEERTEMIIGEKTKPHRTENITETETIEVSISAGNIFETLAIKQKSTDLRDEEYVRREELKQSGILFHQILANTITLQEALLQIKKLYLQRAINQKTYERFDKDITTLFNQPEMKNWLKNYSSYSEYSFCDQNRIIKPDKFFINENEAIIIDFKTGKAMPEYKDQVQGYCKAVRTIFNRPAAGYIYYTQTHEFVAV
jgi:ATP-dependent helicase/nuclease subunit A